MKNDNLYDYTLIYRLRPPHKVSLVTPLMVLLHNLRIHINIFYYYFQVALVYGQMNEPPGARARVALTGLTVAEYFRDVEGQDVLLFIDNIFRFTQAGSEVSALLGRIPSAVGYQPTLATDMGQMQVLKKIRLFFPIYLLKVAFIQKVRFVFQISRSPKKYFKLLS